MLTYIYFVKCPDCEDEHFDFFDEAKEFALGCLSQKPIITQVEVDRNDFGECVNSCDLGTVWSWEDMMEETEAEPTISVFTKDDLKRMADGEDPEFDTLDNSLDSAPDNFCKPGYLILEEDQVLAKNRRGDFVIPAASGYGYTVFNIHNVCIGHIDSSTDEDAIRRFNLGDLDESVERKPIPEGMTIEQLVEEMEENEDTVECTWCNDLFDKSECRKEVNLGWLCSRCEAAIKSRGETLTFKENTYWDFLDEDIEKPVDEDLEWHTYKITFSTKANPDKEQTTTFKTWQSDVEYAWRMSNANIPHTTIKSIELVEDINEDEVDELHDLGNTYDGGYPEDNRNEQHNTQMALSLCPECGSYSYDNETGICINCGFNYSLV